MPYDENEFIYFTEDLYLQGIPDKRKPLFDDIMGRNYDSTEEDEMLEEEE